MGFLKNVFGLKNKTNSLEKIIDSSSISTEDVKKHLENAIHEAKLKIGSIEEFKKGQEDFSNWGNGLILGSMKWIVKKLANRLVEISPNNIYIERTKNWDWQNSNLENFTLLVDASMTGQKAGYYLGKIADDVYGVFGYGFEKVETEKDYDKYLEELKSGRNSLKDAASNGDLNGVKLALEQGADIHEKDERGITPFLWASLNGHQEIVKYLLANGANLKDINNEGFNALMFAAWNNHIETAKSLIESGIDINYEKSVMGSMSNKLTALKVAQNKGHYEMEEFLRSKGAK